MCTYMWLCALVRDLKERFRLINFALALLISSVFRLMSFFIGKYYYHPLLISSNERNEKLFISVYIRFLLLDFMIKIFSSSSRAPRKRLKTKKKLCNYYCLKILCAFNCNISFMIRNEEGKNVSFHCKRSLSYA